MKMLLRSIIVALTGVGMMAVNASAVPFQVTDTDLTINWDSGGGIWNFTSYSMGSMVDLAEGSSLDFTFGQIFIPLAFGTGTADFRVDFSTPDVSGTAGDIGSFEVWSFIVFSGGDLDFGAPSVADYSYLGGGNGLLTIDFDDIIGAQLGSWIDISGSITNTRNSDPVPEPATLLLFGMGLVGLAGVSRRKVKRDRAKIDA